MCTYPLSFTIRVSKWKRVSIHMTQRRKIGNCTSIGVTTSWQKCASWYYSKFVLTLTVLSKVASFGRNSWNTMFPGGWSCAPPTELYPRPRVERLEKKQIWIFEDFIYSGCKFAIFEMMMSLLIVRLCHPAPGKIMDGKHGFDAWTWNLPVVTIVRYNTVLSLLLQPPTDFKFVYQDFKFMYQMHVFRP